MKLRIENKEEVAHRHDEERLRNAHDRRVDWLTMFALIALIVVFIICELR